MKDINPAARTAMDIWARECMDYWAQFDPDASITEEMIEAAPKPPKAFEMDASALITRALTAVVEIQRGGDPNNPSPETVLAVAEVLDQAVDNALAGMGLVERRQASRRLWDNLIDGAP